VRLSYIRLADALVLFCSSRKRVRDAVGRVIASLIEDERIMGMTTLDAYLYVLRLKSSEQISVYDVNSYHRVRRLTVRGVRNAADIVACAHNRCAYISDYEHNSVHKIALSGDTIAQWPVNDRPSGLSLSLTHNVLVTCPHARKIKEFGTDGQLLREVVLPDDVVSPMHSVQLSNGEFIVCHGGSANPVSRACLVSFDGQVVKSYGRRRHPALFSRLAVDKNDFVFGVEMKKRQVLLLSPTLTYVRKVVSHEQFGGHPISAHLDVTRWHLYVADNDYKDGRWSSGRVVVFSR